MKKIVIIKLGTSVVVDNNGIRSPLLEQLYTHIQTLHDYQYHVVVISSGAAKIGKLLCSDVMLSKGNITALGNHILFHEHQKAANQQNITISSHLISHDFFDTAESISAFKSALLQLLENGIVPVINENDFQTALTGTSFSDNDALAATIALSLDASYVYLITEVGGVFEKWNPQQSPETQKPLDTIMNVNAFLEASATKDVSEEGSGGMMSKIKSARFASYLDIPVMISSLQDIRAIYDETYIRTGTLVTPQKLNIEITSQTKKIMCSQISSGGIVVDDGAAHALQQRKSLLGVGVVRVKGSFASKQLVEIYNKKNELIGFGVTDISSAVFDRLRSAEKLYNICVVHAKNLIAL